MFAAQQAKVNASAKELTKENTWRAYDCKQIEFWEYYRHSLSYEESCENITVLKVFGFMIYPCHRTKKGKSDSWVSGPPFIIDDYNGVMKRVNLGSKDVKTNCLISTCAINTTVQ